MSAAQHGSKATTNQNLINQCTRIPRRADDETLARYGDIAAVGDAVSRALILWKEEECLAAQASIPRSLQLSVRRSRGEAIGRILTLIGTPERFFLNREAAECSRRLVLTACFHTSFAWFWRA